MSDHADQNLTQAMQKLKMGSVLEGEVQDRLRQESILPGKSIMAERKGRRVPGTIPLTTNIYGVLMKTIPVYRYDVTIKGIMNVSARTVELSTKAKGDYTLVDHRNICRDVFEALQKSYPSLMKKSKCAYYDLQSILFSLDILDIPTGLSTKYSIPGVQLPKSCARFASCEVEIRAVSQSFRIELNQMGNVSRDLDQAEHTLAQFLDIATSQRAMFSPHEHVTFSTGRSYLIQQADYGFENIHFNDTDAYLAAGAQKAIHFVEGPKNSANGSNASAAVVIETKKTPFHCEDPLYHKAKCLVRNPLRPSAEDVKKLNNALKGLHVETTHVPNRSQFFTIEQISGDTPRNKFITIGEQNVTVENYFKTKHGVTLQYPDSPLVEAKGREGVRYFPMEVCKVCDNQRVKSNQMTSQMSQEMIKRCAVVPFQLRMENTQTANSLHMWDSEFLSNADIKITERPMDVYAHKLSTPAIQFKEPSQVNVHQEKYTWTAGRQYLVPSTCNKWGFFAFLDDRLPRQQLDAGALPDFAKRFMDEVKHKGMSFSPPSEVMCLSPQSAIIRETFVEAFNQGFEFILAIHADTDDLVHSEIKFAERNTSIVTQCIRLGNFRRMANGAQPLVMQNIVNKTNMKLGGLNYSLSFAGAKNALEKDTLYIGFGVNHPGGGLGYSSSDAPVTDSNQFEQTLEKKQSEAACAPTVVGYSANVGKQHDFEFIGDFVFQAPLRDEKYNVVELIAERCLTKFRTNRGRYPTRIILYRNGCSEGQFSHILKYEVPLIKNQIQKQGCKASLTILVVNKHQSVRFFNKDIDRNARAPMQNVRPGTVVDAGAVHPEYFDFFLNSHVAIQGTAKTPRYTVLYDENNYGIQQLENLTFQLCFGHQIVNSPTSLPSPVYIANEYAKRGRNLFKRWQESGEAKNLTYLQLGDRLSFHSAPFLPDLRVNA